MNALADRIEPFPRHALAAALLAGLALSEAPEVAVATAAVLAALICFAVRFDLAVALVACGLVIAGSALGALRIASIDADPLAAVNAANDVSVHGYLLALPRHGERGVSLRARVQANDEQWQTIEIRAYEQLTGDARIGDELIARGRLTAISDAAARSAEAASYARYLIRNGVRRRMQAREIALTGARRGGITGAIDSIRTRSERTLAAGLAPEPAALLRGMVLGGDAGLTESTVEAFRAAGLSHILAVSGQNVLLIVILVQAIAVALNLPRRWRIAIPAALVCIYVPLCGAQASVLRAGAMGLAGLAAIAASRPSSRMYALLLAAIFVFAWNPRATADVGAQLSFAAVLGIMAFTMPVARRLTRLPSWVAEAFAATFGATIATAPLMAFHFGAVSLVSLAANVLGAPMIGPIVWLGSLSAAIGQFAQPVGSLLNAPNGFLLGALIELAHGAAAVPMAQVALRGFSSWTLLALATPIVVAAAWLNGWWRPPAQLIDGWNRLRARARPLRGALMASIAVAVLAITMFGWPRRAPPPRPAIAFLNVGQGDATVLMGSEGCNALIDGGPPGAGLGRQLKRLGVDHLDLVLTTHPQLDHFGGIAEIARAGRPKVKDFLDGGGAQQVAEYSALRGDLTSNGARLSPAVAGTHWRCGELALQILAPAEASVAASVEDANTIAAVTVATVGPIRMFASGDAESPQLSALPLPNVDVLKVPHHGSADAGLGEVLARIDPEISVIEVGRDNRYGHPTAQTLQQLAAAGSVISRTDRDGTVLVSADAEGAIQVGRQGE